MHFHVRLNFIRYLKDIKIQRCYIKVLIFNYLLNGFIKGKSNPSFFGYKYYFCKNNRWYYNYAFISGLLKGL